MKELKPCPFCGGTAVSVQNVTPRLCRPIRNHPYSVVCWECDLWFGYDEDYGGMFDTETEAVKAWNRRASDENSIMDYRYMRGDQSGSEHGADHDD